MNRISKSNKLGEFNQNSLPIKKNYSATTQNVAVTVWPEFIDGKVGLDNELYVWAYQILIENKGSDALQLVKRTWHIIDEKGNIQEVSGDGVVGEQPIILPNASYKYSSGVHLNSPSGIMKGKYFVKRINDNQILEIEIPSFSLDVPANNITLN